MFYLINDQKLKRPNLFIGGDWVEQPDQHHGQQDLHRHPQGHPALHHAQGRGNRIS